MATVTGTLALVALVVFAGGIVKGIAGFGYGVASTALLAVVLDPAAAVVVMILPTLVANVVLLRELSGDDLRTCYRRFRPYLLAAVVGTAVGMLFLQQVPAAAVALLLGVVALGYAGLKQPWVRVPGTGRLAATCATEARPVATTLGLVSGVVFGASNVGVQVVAYLDGLDLDRTTFVGVLAMIFVGISTLRVAMAWGLGLFAGGETVGLSLLAVLPGVVGVRAGGLVRARLPERVLVTGVVVLLVATGVQLTTTGLRGL